MNPQTNAAFYRGLALTGVVALATAGEAAVAHLLTGDDTRTVVVAAIGAGCNMILARLGEGQFDANRAAAVARGHLSALRRSDIGYTRLERSIAAEKPPAP